MSTPTTVDLLLKVSADTEDIKKATNAFNGFWNTVKTGFTLKVGEKIAEGISAIPRLAGDAIRSAVQLGDELQEIGDRLNINPEAFQVLANASKEAGADVNVLTRGISEMQRTLADAAIGKGTALATFQGLGLDAGVLQGMEVEEQFQQIAKAIAGATDKQQAFRAVVDIFGTQSGPRLQGMLRRLSDEGFGEMADKIRSTHGIMSSDTVAAMDRISDTWSALKTRFIVIVAELIPKFTPLIDTLTKIADLALRAFAWLSQIGDNIGQGLGMLIYGKEAVEAAIKAEEEARRKSDDARKKSRAGIRGDVAKEAEEVARLRQLEGNLAQAKAEQAVVEGALLSIQARAQQVAGDSLLEQSAKTRELSRLGGIEYKNQAEKNAKMVEQLQLLREIKQLRDAGFVSTGDNSAAAVAMRNVVGVSPRDSGLPQGKVEAFQQSQQIAGEIAKLSGEIDQSMVSAAAKSSELGRSANMLLSVQQGLTGMVDGFKTIGGVITDNIGGGIQTVSQNLTEALMTTKSWDAAVLSIAGSIGTTFVKSIVDMGVQWLVTQALIKSGLISTKAISSALRTADVVESNSAEAAKAPAIMANAAGASISSFGIAAAIGIAALIAVMAAFGGFADGGFTGYGSKFQPAGLVHAGEVVWSQADVSRWGGASVVDSMRLGRAYPAAGAASVAMSDVGGPKQSRFLLVDRRDLGMYRNEPGFENMVVDISHRRRSEIYSGDSA